ncbi:MAG: PqqD family peptide modification chaperone [Rubrivivax sp.]|nr:MAG: PqqD family peptide modification chaperone [Rubrivivax sp.]
MQDSLLSPYWYRIAALHPRLRPHVSVRMQTTRGQAWYVLFNQATGRHHRVNAQAYEVVGRLDGRHTVEEVWSVLIDQMGDDAPSQHDVIRILGQMTDAGLIQAEVTPDVRQMVKTDETRLKQERRNRLNPLSFRLGLFNPSMLLEKLTPLGQVLWTSWAQLIWLLLVLGAGWAAVVDHREIVAYGRTYFMSPGYLAAAWVIYPLMKALHELGHALALRRYGCEVPEVGVNFFMFVPMPYVDASASNKLVNRWQRARISAAGISVELALAALAAIVWLNVEDGWLRQVAFVVMSLGGMSTLLFNGNPLMKLDGYYVLCDALDLPNLAGRSGKTVSHVLRKLALWCLRIPRDPDDIGVVPADGLERWALRMYAPASWLYRLTVTALIVGWAADKTAWLGVGVAAWSAWTLVIKPFAMWFETLSSMPGFAAVRGRAWAGMAVLAAALVAAVAWIPLPSTLVVEGVVWLPDDALVRSSTDGEIEALWVRSEQEVEPGQALITLRAPTLETEREVLRSQIERSEYEVSASFGSDPLKMQNAQEALIRDRAALAQVEKDLSSHVLRAGAAGRFVLSREADLDGHQVTRGQVLAYVLGKDASMVRAVVPQRYVDDVRHRIRSIEVMLDEAPGRVIQAKWLREVPAAADKLPQPAMADRAGGRVPTDPTDSDALRPMEPMFVIDLAMPDSLPRAGGLARVQIALQPQSVLTTLSQRVRQLFLKHFSDIKA